MQKDPNAVLDYAVNWADWLDEGETITDSTWTVSGSAAKDSDSIDGDRAVIWLSGGVPDERIRATNHISTSQGRQDERSLYVDIADR